MKRFSLTGHEEPNGEFVLFEEARCSKPCENRVAKTSHMMRAYRDGMRNAARLVREYEIEHNKLYRERLAKFLEEKAK